MQITTLFWLAVIGIAAIGFAILPSRQRFWVVLTTSIVWWTVARMPDLPASPLALKAVYVPPLLIISAALADPRSKESPKLAKGCWVLLAVAVAAIFFVHSVIDFRAATIGRIGWVFTVAAGLASARLIGPRRNLGALVTSLAVGSGIVLGICLAQIAVDPAAAFGGSYTRFSPWGLNPNSVGPVLAVGVGATLLSVPGRGLLGGLALRALMALSVGVILLTESRGNLLLVAFCVLPVFLYSLRRRPVTAALSAGALVASVYYVLGQIEATRLDRLSTLESARGDLAAIYFREVQERPFFGLLFSTGEQAQTLLGLTLDEHNAYLRLLYLGGLALFVPVTLVSILALRRAIRFLGRADATSRPHALLLVSVFVGMFVFGYTNRLMYEPTGYWPFLHATLIAAMLTWGRPDATETAPQLMQPRVSVRG